MSTETTSVTKKPLLIASNGFLDVIVNAVAAPLVEHMVIDESKTKAYIWRVSRRKNIRVASDMHFSHIDGVNLRKSIQEIF